MRPADLPPLVSYAEITNHDPGCKQTVATLGNPDLTDDVKEPSSGTRSTCLARLSNVHQKYRNIVSWKNLLRPNIDGMLIGK